MGLVVYLDTILVPMSVFVIVGYHAYLSHSIKNNPSSTTFGTNKLKRSAWRLNLDQGDDKKGMLVIQSLRNTLMATIFTATITILMSLALAALNNNAYTASHHHHHMMSSKLFGSKSDILSVLKYASASLFLAISFMFSSMAIAFLIDANFWMNAHHHHHQQLILCEEEGYTKTILERAFTLPLIANRLLCSSLPLFLWMLGPIPLFFSSLALVWWLHHLDFLPNFSK
ncbi:uncharacterized protein G2W53_016573 [Senna tora]|uniref:Uncharacterized protein n=1 Tax=Senna tora TaxID=362788 RepID=A0A834WQA8_9FABA|nr:uncharacterized protein G2W53_016573 [Senna tora]